MKGFPFGPVVAVIVVLVLAGGFLKQHNRPVLATSTPTSSVNQQTSTKNPLAQSTIKEMKITSTALGKQMNVNIYLPKGYTSEKKYPVLYVLHGKDGDENTWFSGNFLSGGIKINKRADELIDQNKINPLIIVSPQYDNSYAINSSPTVKSENGYSLGPYEDYFMKDLIPAIDANFSTISSAEGRFITGNSMGGYAALHLAFAHPDMFSKVGGDSAAVWAELPAELNWLYPDAKSQSVNDPITQAQTADISHLQIYLDHGDMDMDHVIAGENKLADVLKQRGIPYQLHVGTGGHDNGYWGSQAANYLLFYVGK